MPHSHPDSEEALEKATMALFAQLGWQTANCFEEVIGPSTDVRRNVSIWAARPPARSCSSPACAWRWKSSTPICMGKVNLLSLEALAKAQ
jgi:hypothetical protein